MCPPADHHHLVFYVCDEANSFTPRGGRIASQGGIHVSLFPQPRCNITVVFDRDKRIEKICQGFATTCHLKKSRV